MDPLIQSKHMSWREQVLHLEQEGDFDIAIFLLAKIIKNNPEDMHAYIFLLFRLMDTLVEGSYYWTRISQSPLREIKSKYYRSKHDLYWKLAHMYFQMAYSKFQDNADFLYYVAHIATFAPWYFGIDKNDHEIIQNMFKKSKHISPHNPLLKGGYEDEYLTQQTYTKTELIAYGTIVISQNEEILKDMGSLGKYLLELKQSVVKEYLAQCIQ